MGGAALLWVGRGCYTSFTHSPGFIACVSKGTWHDQQELNQIQAGWPWGYHTYKGIDHHLHSSNLSFIPLFVRDRMRGQADMSFKWQGTRHEDNTTLSLVRQMLLAGEWRWRKWYGDKWIGDIWMWLGREMKAPNAVAWDILIFPWPIEFNSSLSLSFSHSRVHLINRCRIHPPIAAVHLLLSDDLVDTFRQ